MPQSPCALGIRPGISSRFGDRLWVPLFVLDQCLGPSFLEQRTGRVRPVAPRLRENKQEVISNLFLSLGGNLSEPCRRSPKTRGVAQLDTPDWGILPQPPVAFEGDSKVVWCDGNYQTYETQRKERLGLEADQPHRIKYRHLTR